MTAASSDGNDCNNASVVDPDNSAFIPDAAKLVSSHCNGTPAAAAAGRDATVHNFSFALEDNVHPNGKLAMDHDSLPTPKLDALTHDSFNKLNDGADHLPCSTQTIHQNGTLAEIDSEPHLAPGRDSHALESAVNDSPQPDLAASLDATQSVRVNHDPQEGILASISSKSSEPDAGESTSNSHQNYDPDDLPAATNVTHQNGTLDSEPHLASGQDSHVWPSVSESPVDGVDGPEPVLAASLDATESTPINHEPQEGILVSISSKSSEHEVIESTSVSMGQQNYDTDDLPAATNVTRQNESVADIDSEPHLASGQDSHVVPSVLESPVDGVDSPEPDLAASLDATESTHVNHEPQEGILVSISSKSSEPDVSESTSMDQQNYDTADLPAATNVTHQNETVVDSAVHQLVHRDINSELSPSPGRDNQDSLVADSVLESTVNGVDSSEPVSALPLAVIKSSDAYREPQEDNLDSISIRPSEAEVNQSTSNLQNDDAADLHAATKVIHQNGTVENSALHQSVHHEIDPKLSPAPGQDNQEFEVTASVLKSEVDLVDSPEPDLAVSLDVTKSPDVYHEPQGDNLVSLSCKSSEADDSLSTTTNQQNLESFDKFLGPQESENAYSDATHANLQQAEVQVNVEPVALLEGELVILEHLESSQFDMSEQRIEEETKTGVLSEVEENQPTIVEISEHGLSNLDQGSEAEQTVYGIDFSSSAVSATDNDLNNKKDHLLVPSSSDWVQDTEELNGYPDEPEKSLELDESLTHSDTLSPAPVCLRKETDIVGEPIESFQKSQESNGGNKFPDGASSLTNADVGEVCDPEIEDPVNVSVQSLDKLPDIPSEHGIEFDSSTPAGSHEIDTDEVVEPETDIVSAVSANPEGASSSPVSNERSEIMLYEDASGNDLGKSIDRFSTDSTTARAEFELGIADSGEKVLSCQVDAHDMSKVAILDAESANSHSVQSHAEVKPEVDGMHSSGMDSEGMLCNSDLASKFEVSDSSMVTVENAPGTILELKDVEVEEDQPPVSDVQHNDNLIGQESENMENSHSNEPSVSLLESSTADALAGQDVAVGILTRPFQFLIRIPRFDDWKVREQIKHAQLQVDEKTKIRDAFRFEIQKHKANCHGHAAEYEAAVSKARSSKRSVKSKRAEIDSLQVVLNKVKNAISVDDIDARIYSMEHMIQHETMPLKEEKQFIREIKQLKQLREQLSSNIGSQDEVQQALKDREETEERLKVLKKELDHLKDGVFQAETVARAAQNKYEDENRKLKELISEFEEANDVRQSAYQHLQSLRKELFDKNKLFRMYKDTAAAASDLAASRDRDALHHLCHNQVETIMESWNKDKEFRKEYVQCNARSTVRRFGTLDGRSLGPDEEPPVLASVGVERRDRSNSNQSNGSSVVQAPMLKQVNQRKPAEDAVTDGSNKAKEEGAKNQTAKNVEVAKHSLGNGSMTFSGRGINDEMSEKEYSPTKEEVELARKAEELRKEEYAARLREQRRLEEKSKAVEALERKKRNAEKAQLRAELRAQKEAEQKEKEREKRLRKKERKKAEISDGESTPRSEMVIETIKEKEGEAVKEGLKRAVKASSVVSKTKSMSIPPPLRNRSKRKMQQWMWVTITCMLVVFVFVLGNVGFFSNLSNLRPRNNSNSNNL